MGELAVWLYRGCSVTGPRVVHLPGPVASITDVRIDGAVLDDSGYQLEETPCTARTVHGLAKISAGRSGSPEPGR